MIKISIEASVKLETLAPKVARSIQHQFKQLKWAQTRTQLEAEGKIKPIHDLPNFYSLETGTNYLVIFQTEENEITITDLMNLAFLEYARKTTESPKPD